MGLKLSRALCALVVAAIATTALPSRAAIPLSGSVVERSAPIRIASCSVDADEATFVPHVLFTDQLAKPITSATVVFEFLDTAGVPLVRVAVVVPAGRTSLPTFPAGATSVACALERATFKDGTTFVYGGSQKSAATGAIVGGALAIGAAAAIVAGSRKTSGGAGANAAASATPMPGPTSTALSTPTPTPFPTAPAPATPRPTASPAPTATPLPGATPTPIRTSSPAPLATQHAIIATPIPAPVTPRPAPPTRLPVPPQPPMPRGHAR